MKLQAILLFGTLVLTVTVKADWSTYPYLFDPFVAEDRHVFALFSQFAKDMSNLKPTPLEYNATLEHAIELFITMRNPHYRNDHGNHIDYVDHRLYFNQNTRQLEYVEKHRMSKVKEENTLKSFRLLFHVMREDILRNIKDTTLREKMTEAIGTFDANHHNEIRFWQVLSSLRTYVLANSDMGNWDFFFSKEIMDVAGEVFENLFAEVENMKEQNLKKN